MCIRDRLIQISQKFNNLKNDIGNLGENKLLLITAVKIMDEYYETKKKVEQRKDEFKNLLNSDFLGDNIIKLNQLQTELKLSKELINITSKKVYLSRAYYDSGRIDSDRFLKSQTELRVAKINYSRQLVEGIKLITEIVSEIV